MHATLDFMALERRVFVVRHVMQIQITLGDAPLVRAAGPVSVKLDIMALEKRAPYAR